MYEVDNWIAPLFPSIVIGFELKRTPRGGWTNADNRIHQIHCQTAGLACGQRGLIGYLLRLQDGFNHSRRDVSPIVKGFQRIGESGPILAPPFEDLDAFGDTHGDPYNPGELDELDLILSKYFGLPKLQSGEEAFLRFEPDDLIRYFWDWPIITTRRRTDVDGDAAADGGLFAPFVHVVDSNYISDHNMNAFTFEPTSHLDHQAILTLENLAESSEIDEPPRAFLVWENSD